MILWVSDAGRECAASTSACSCTCRKSGLPDGFELPYRLERRGYRTSARGRLEQTWQCRLGGDLRRSVLLHGYAFGELTVGAEPAPLWAYLSGFALIVDDSPSSQRRLPRAKRRSTNALVAAADWRRGSRRWLTAARRSSASRLSLVIAQPNTAGRGRLTLVLGGARSGKSRHAQILAMATPPPWVYVATAQALDDEMAERIAKHKAARRDGWSTIEEPIELTRAVAHAPESAPLVVDCITLWLSNLMLGGPRRRCRGRAVRSNVSMDERRRPLSFRTKSAPASCLTTPLGRAFRDQAGIVNQHLARERPQSSIHGGRARPATEGTAMTEEQKPDEQERHRAKMANRKAAQDAEVASKTIREGTADRPYRHGQGQIDRGLRPRAAHGRQRREMRAWCNSSRAHGTPASGACWRASAIRCAGTRWAKASPGRRRTKRATCSRGQGLGNGEGADAGSRRSS